MTGTLTLSREAGPKVQPPGASGTVDRVAELEKKVDALFRLLSEIREEVKK